MRKLILCIIVTIVSFECRNSKQNERVNWGGIDFFFYKQTLDMEEKAGLPCFGCQIKGNIRIYSLSPPKYLADIDISPDDSINVRVFKFDKNLIIIETKTYVFKSNDKDIFYDAIKNCGVPNLTTVYDLNSLHDEKGGYVIKNDCYYVNQFYFPSRAFKANKQHLSFISIFESLLER